MDKRTLEFFLLIGALLFSFTLSAFLVKKQIKKAKQGQQERDYLANHIVKSGTPTMGGISIIGATIITFFLFNKFSINREILTILIVYIGFFLVGFFDDYNKLKFKSYRGISGKLRLLLETLIVVWGLVVLTKNQSIDNFLSFKLNNKTLSFGVFTIPLIVFIVVGSSNAFNLTDGLDGLASGLNVIALLPFMMLSLMYNHYSLSLFLMCQIGSLLGFLCYNIHPAKIFMGDVGSLPLGALLGISAIILNRPFILLLTGMIFVIETVSVIIQVISFQTTGKRVFLMTPIHHHFEKKGWEEWKVVMVFWLVGIIFSLLAIIAGVLK